VVLIAFVVAVSSEAVAPAVTIRHLELVRTVNDVISSMP
jgi:hypothetical protein